MLILKHNEHIMIYINFIAPHISPVIFPAPFSTHFLPGKYFTPPDTSFNLCWRAEVWTASTWLLVIQKVYDWGERSMG